MNNGNLAARSLCILALFIPPLAAQEMTAAELVTQLQAGGKVIVMRHASSPRDLPDADSANAGNVNRERQLDAGGREDARRFGEALRRLGITIAETGSSPAFRAMETARQAGLGDIVAYEQLGNEGMQAGREEQAGWLRMQAASGTPAGNRLLITHSPNITAAFPEVGRTGEGEALVFDPAVSNQVPIGRIAISAWPSL